MGQPALTVALAFAGYLLGSIPFGVLVSRALGKPDPRTAGSRNMGFTNVLRVGGTTAGVLTLIGDMGKGGVVAAVAASLLTSPAEAITVAATPVLGHLFPVFLRFQGGKGVATAFGVLLGLHPVLGLAAVGIWLSAAALWRYSSGAAITAFVLLPAVAMVARVRPELVLLCLFFSIVIIVKHRANIMRLWHGTEPKIGRRAASGAGGAGQPMRKVR